MSRHPLAQPVDATLAAHDLPGSELAHECRRTSPRRCRQQVAARLAIRAGGYRRPTAGLAPGFVQANLAILPARLASDFLGTAS
jgi:hypothetical protein